jgi:hypothetical protein
MASDKAITSALLETVRDLFKTDQDQLSVNNVRKIVEEKLDLSAGLLKGDAWKAKSKDIIIGEVVSTLPIPILGATLPPPPSRDQKTDIVIGETRRRPSASTRAEREACTKAKSNEETRAGEERDQARCSGEGAPEKETEEGGYA